MDSTSQQSLAHLIRESRIAALGTIHDGSPNLAMVAIAFESDFSALYVYASRLGKHATDMKKNPHVSLLITETDDQRADPQTLARVAIDGMAEILPRNESDYLRVRTIYLNRFPEAEQLFSLGDFDFWKIRPAAGRYVAGFGRAFNIVPETLIQASSIQA